MVAQTNYVVIDDDPINNLICNKNLQLLFPNDDIRTFTDPVEGYDYIVDKYNQPETGSILFLDIDMPFLNGWDILEKFAGLPNISNDNFKIYILTSSIANEDKKRSNSNPLVSGFIEKPLNMFQLKRLFPEAN